MKSIWTQITELEHESGWEATFVLRLKDGAPVVQVDESLRIMHESPFAESGTAKIVNVPDDVRIHEFHDSQRVNDRVWENILGHLLEELEEHGGRIIFEMHPVCWDRDPDDDPHLLETEPTIYEGWSILVREQVGEEITEKHEGHVMPLTGAWYCDTCDSPYCDLA